MAAPPQVNRYHPFSLVDGDGNFNKNIGNDLDLAHENCAAVSIIGVQSSGKSTLLNKCFSTNFEEMDESQGMIQTTKGIWIAKGPSSNDGPKILVIDTEGSDSSERRRQGDDSFERKMAAFALATSNTVIFNMECKNVGRHDGASRPLLQTIFRVMLHKFTSTPRKLNLMFVLRDKNRSPLDKLEKQLREGLDEIWQGISSSKANRKAKLKDYFNVEVMTMSSYATQKKEFDEDVVSVRQRLFSLVKGGQPCRASVFFDLAKRNWDDIMENKILNVNLNKVTVDKVHCEDIKEKKFENFLQDENWRKTKKAVESGIIVQGFGKLVNSIMGKYLSQYDEETLYTNESTRNHYRKQLTQNLSQVVEQSYFLLVQNMKSTTLKNFEEEIVKGIIARGGKVAFINSKRFITKFRDLLGDAHVQLASWNHTSSQLEKMQSELNSYEEGARNIIEILKTKKKYKALMWTGATTFTTEALAFSAAVGLASLAAPVDGGATAVAAATAIPLPLASIGTVIGGYIKYKETKEHMKKDRKENVVVDKIMRKVDSHDS